MWFISLVTGMLLGGFTDSGGGVLAGGILGLAGGLIYGNLPRGRPLNQKPKAGLYRPLKCNRPSLRHQQPYLLHQRFQMQANHPRHSVSAGQSSPSLRKRASESS